VLQTGISQRRQRAVRDRRLHSGLTYVEPRGSLEYPVWIGQTVRLSFTELGNGPSDLQGNDGDEGIYICAATTFAPLGDRNRAAFTR